MLFSFSSFSSFPRCSNLNSPCIEESGEIVQWVDTPKFPRRDGFFFFPFFFFLRFCNSATFADKRSRSYARGQRYLGTTISRNNNHVYRREKGRVAAAISNERTISSILQLSVGHASRWHFNFHDSIFYFPSFTTIL